MAPQTIDPDHFSADTRSLLELLHRHHVRYVIVGGEAVIFHGHARYTGDVDFLYDRSQSNVKALFEALTEFWEGDIPGIHSPDELLEEAIVVQFGRPPNRIDLLSSIDGVDFHEAWDNRVTVEFAANSDGQPVPIFILGLATLLKNKSATARPKDLDDLRYLSRVEGGTRHPGWNQ